jgi:NitT/TauT family transport system substrate-binding protein
MRVSFFLAVFALSFVAEAAKVTLVLNWKPEAEFGGFYAAELSKAFAKEGLEVTIQPGGVGTPAVQMVTAGQAEFGISSADEVILSQDRGSDAVGLFAVYQTNPQGMMVRSDRRLVSFSDIFGSGILAVQKGLPYFLYLEKKWGKPKAKVVPFLGGITQLSENPLVTQQCFVTSEPILAEQKGIEVKTFFIADAGFNPYTALVVVKRSFAQKNPALVASFKKAVVAGWQAYLADPEPANEAMHALNPSMSREVLTRSARIQAPLIQTAETKTSGLGSMTEQRWNELAQQLLDIQLIKKAQPAANYVWK